MLSQFNVDSSKKNIVETRIISKVLQSVTGDKESFKLEGEMDENEEKKMTPKGRQLQEWSDQEE